MAFSQSPPTFSTMAPAFFLLAAGLVLRVGVVGIVIESKQEEPNLNLKKSHLRSDDYEIRDGMYKYLKIDEFTLRNDEGLEEYFDYDDLFNIAPQLEEKDKSTKEFESSKKSEEEIVEENEKVDGDATVEAAAAEDEFDYDFLFEAPPNSGHPSWITEANDKRPNPELTKTVEVEENKNASSSTESMKDYYVNLYANLDKTRETTFEKFLRTLSVEEVNSFDMETIMKYSRNDSVIDMIGLLQLDTLYALVKRMTADDLVALANRPGVIKSLPFEAAITFSKRTGILQRVDRRILIDFADARSTLIPSLDKSCLDMFIEIPGFIRSLSPKTLKFLITSEELASKISTMDDSMVKLVNREPGILAVLPDFTVDYPLKRTYHSWNRNKNFLKRIDVRTYARIAEMTGLQSKVDETTILKVLSLYPRLPALLRNKGINNNRHLLRDPAFLRKVSCSVFLNLAGDKTFLQRLTKADLHALAGVTHMWRCLPVTMVRKIMQETDVMSKVDLEYVMVAASSMSTAQSMDFQVVLNFLRQNSQQSQSQILTTKKKKKKNFLDWIQSYLPGRG